MRYIALLFLIFLISGCASFDNYIKEKDVKDLDRLYSEGKINERKYLELRSELLNRDKKNIKYQYVISK